MTALALTDLQLERSLIAVALHDFGKFLARGVVADDFADPECRRVFDLAMIAYESGKPVTHGAIVACVQSPAQAREFAPTLAAFRAEVPPDHERLRRLRQLRNVRELALSAAARAELGDMDAAQTALEAAQSAAVVRDDSQPILTAHGLATRFVERLGANAKAVRTHVGMRIFAQAVGSLVPGSQIVLAADSNVGKTGYALELLVATAANGVKCGFISCEDPEDVLTPRLIASHASGLSSRELQTGTVPGHMGAELDRALGAMVDRMGSNLMMSFPVGGTDMDVCGEMSRMVALGCRLLVVDYVQTIEPSKKQQDRRNEIRWIASRLKKHAHRLGVPYILLSQLTVPTDAPPNWEPTKHSLKESRDLTNASETVVVMWRREEDDGAPVTCKLVKSKIGNVGATWAIQRNENAVVHEVAGSYQTAQQNRQARDQGEVTSQPRGRRGRY